MKLMAMSPKFYFKVGSDGYLFSLLSILIMISYIIILFHHICRRVGTYLISSSYPSLSSSLAWLTLAAFPS